MKSTSRQRAWQRRKRAEGLCQTCGKPRGASRWLCDEHLRLNRERQRRLKGTRPDRQNLKYRWSPKEYNRIAARMKRQYEAGESLAVIALRHRLSDATVKKMLKLVGVALRRQGRRAKGTE